ncbi:hypothetical protein LO772_29845 [Yinghuangia sp. ASG 101]|uniref:hypothetical protein n=1 Tax=Yinghuangia sp. ASG 101 TaxID=2896848 RepID=UPI001E2E8897|nr:hypothetical protein [Yinghuangia sp. ASG 101]UGQ10970.1 hypothetical protein LO772_29845 [Yinghuangia sp. ASG 101]
MSSRIRPTIMAIRHLAPGAARVRTHISPRGHGYAAVFDQGGVRLSLRLADRAAIGHWVTRAFPGIDWTEPHTLDLAAERVFRSAAPDEPIASAHTHAGER